MVSLSNCNLEIFNDSYIWPYHLLIKMTYHASDPIDNFLAILRREIEFLLSNLNQLPIGIKLDAIASYLFNRSKITKFGKLVLVYWEREESQKIETVYQESPLPLKIDNSSRFGRVEIVFENSMVGVYNLIVRPGACIATHCHNKMTEAEMILTSGLYVQGRPISRFSQLKWPKGHYHRYDNPTCFEQIILCIDQPAFDLHDEKEETRFCKLTMPQES